MLGSGTAAVSFATETAQVSFPAELKPGRDGGRRVDANRDGGITSSRFSQLSARP